MVKSFQGSKNMNKPWEWIITLQTHSWERGTNENTNGILRRYFPKGTDFLTLTESVVSSAVMKINLMPKKCLGWMTPFEVHWGEKLQLTWQCGK